MPKVIVNKEISFWGSFRIRTLKHAKTAIDHLIYSQVAYFSDRDRPFQIQRDRQGSSI